MLPGLTDLPHYAFYSDSDAPYRTWDISVPLERIAAEMEAEGWQCTPGETFMGFPFLECIHLPTAQAQEQERT